jgi:hypothetical protein
MPSESNPPKITRRRSERFFKKEKHKSLSSEEASNGPTNMKLEDRQIIGDYVSNYFLTLYKK